ncbi:hypothetical protein GW17_00061638 [Ensete ventricosum]|nr:hypothetical protein GW17_00061638 [Ensete ventricosum]
MHMAPLFQVGRVQLGCAAGRERQSGVLRSANPATCAAQCLQDLLHHRRRVAKVATGPPIGAKQYLARHPSQGQWQDHFGRHWDRFVARKPQFDPLSILPPAKAYFAGHMPLPRRTTSLSLSTTLGIKPTACTTVPFHDSAFLSS